MKYYAGIGWADSIGMCSKISQIKSQKKKTKPKTRWIQIKTTLLTYLCDETPLSSRKTAPSTLINLNPIPLNLDPTTTVEMLVI
jgi:hypothetical protein